MHGNHRTSGVAPWLGKSIRTGQGLAHSRGIKVMYQSLLCLSDMTSFGRRRSWVRIPSAPLSRLAVPSYKTHIGLLQNVLPLSHDWSSQYSVSYSFTPHTLFKRAIIGCNRYIYFVSDLHLKAHMIIKNRIWSRY